jgi:hypothetical protein
MLRSIAMAGLLAVSLGLGNVSAAPATSDVAKPPHRRGHEASVVSAHRDRPPREWAWRTHRSPPAMVPSTWQPPSVPDDTDLADMPVRQAALPPLKARPFDRWQPRGAMAEVALAPPLAPSAAQSAQDRDGAWQGQAVAPSGDDFAARPPPQEIVLTQQERGVGDFAARKGDTTFLMVDKLRGRIILFEHGQPLYSGAALTGHSLADALPAKAEGKTFDDLSSLSTKVTPAGRYSVRRHPDPSYGTVFDVNEVKGLDWGIAIHKVYLGTPSEHRAERIRSPSADVKHITYGCINVTPEFLRLLMHELPDGGVTPLYILPIDETLTASYFSASTGSY